MTTCEVFCCSALIWARLPRCFGGFVEWATAVNRSSRSMGSALHTHPALAGDCRGAHEYALIRGKVRGPRSGFCKFPTCGRTLRMNKSHPMSSQDLHCSVIADGKVLEITTTTGCVVGCSYCPQDKFAARQRAVSHAKYLRVEDFKKCLAREPAAVTSAFRDTRSPGSIRIVPKWLSMPTHLAMASGFPRAS